MTNRFWCVDDDAHKNDNDDNQVGGRNAGLYVCQLSTHDDDDDDNDYWW